MEDHIYILFMNELPCINKYYYYYYYYNTAILLYLRSADGQVLALVYHTEHALLVYQ